MSMRRSHEVTEYLTPTGLGGLTDPVVNLRGRECVQDLQQCRLVKGHRGLCPFARTIGLVSLTIARWPLQPRQLRRQAGLPTPLGGTPLVGADRATPMGHRPHLQARSDGSFHATQP